ncbi:chitobiase/beta-hexosaminidase C-terminal domain-containing protein, partial [Bacillus horti]|uniref:chitobiase/beta-hexosaminidase C-terminal domain-containing protein n=1 Tax=Caldalkalibacillus horti TaxID=77523 RepID=UPI0031DD3FCA
MVAPVASPAGGEYAAGTSVELTTATEGATIYYSTDGSEATRSSAEYTAPIEITEAMTIKAIAVKDGMTDSEVMEEHYTILLPEQVVAPVASPAGGAVASGTTVELTTETSGATIYYSTDGSEATRSSSEYTEPIEITEAMTIKAIAVKDGMSDSEMLEEHYTVLPPEQVVAPVADPEGGAVTSGTTVELTTATSGATIYYTTDGSKPTRASAEYTAPIEITEAMTIKAIAVKDGMSDSEVMEEHYTITTRPGPANLTASAGDRSVTLKWSDATETGTVTYAVYQVEGPSAPADPVNWTLVQSNIPGNSYTVTELTNGKTYAFAVKANYADGASDFSNVTTATPRAAEGNGGSGGVRGGLVLSDNTHLADLQIWGNDKKLTLSPAFAPNTTEYTGQTEAEQIEITAKPAYFAAKVMLQDEVITDRTKVQLEDGANILILTVQAENGSKKEYTLTIHRDTPKLSESEIHFMDITGHWAESEIKRA